MTRRSRLLLPIGAVLALAACGNTDNTPENYDSDDGQVGRNFTEACLEANDGLDNAAEVCGCTWAAFVQEVPFDIYLEFDRTIRENVGEAGDNRDLLADLATNVVREYNDKNREDPYEGDLIELIEQAGDAPPCAFDGEREETTTTEAN